MTDNFLHDQSGACYAVLSTADIYQYKGFTFEISGGYFPYKLNKDLEESRRSGRKFYKTVDEWHKLTKEQKERTRIL